MRPRSRISAEIRRIQKAGEQAAARAAGTECERGEQRGRKSRPARHAHVAVTPDEAERIFRAWFSSHGWRPFEFQTRAWRAKHL